MCCTDYHRSHVHQDNYSKIWVLSLAKQVMIELSSIFSDWGSIFPDNPQSNTIHFFNATFIEMQQSIQSWIPATMIHAAHSHTPLN